MSGNKEQKYLDVFCSKKQFVLMKDNPGFLLLLRLSRVINAISFSLITVYELNGKSSPSNRRQLVNSFLFTCGILYEGLEVAKGLGKYYRHIEEFNEGLGKIISNKDIKKLQSKVLYKLRNKIVFHFDEEVFSDIINDIDHETYIFANGSKSSAKDLYFSLADEIAINYVLSDFPDKENHEEIFIQIITDVTNTALDFKRSSEKLIAKVLADMKWDIRECENFT